jgi:hypothetical protein
MTLAEYFFLMNCEGRWVPAPWRTIGGLCDRDPKSEVLPKIREPRESVWTVVLGKAIAHKHIMAVTPKAEPLYSHS